MKTQQQAWFLLVPGTLGCLSAIPFNGRSYAFTCYTTEIVYRQPFHWVFDLWLTSSTTIEITYYTLLIRRKVGNVMVTDLDERVGEIGKTMFTVTSGNHFVLDREILCDAEPGTPYYVDLIIRNKAGGSWGFNFEKMSGGGQPYHTKDNPYYFVPGTEYHPHRASYDFARPQMVGKDSCLEYYYCFAQSNDHSGQVLAPFLARFEKRYEDDSSPIMTYATNVTLKVKNHYREFKNIADRADANTGDVYFDLVSQYENDAVRFLLKRSLYIDKGTCEMSKTLKDAKRQIATKELLMPLSVQGEDARYDCEVTFKMDKEYWAFLTTQKNEKDGLAPGGNRYYIDMEIS